MKVYKRCTKKVKKKYLIDKAIAMMRRKSPRSANIYLVESQCQANISKWRRGKELNTFSWMRKKLYFVYMSLW